MEAFTIQGDEYIKAGAKETHRRDDKSGRLPGRSDIRAGTKSLAG